MKDRPVVRIRLIVLSLILLLTMAFIVGYFFEIRPNTDREVNNLMDNLTRVNGTENKIREIANFTVKDYYQTFGEEPHYPLLLFYWGFLFGEIPMNINQKPHLKPGLFFINDPYFIIYYKTGACGELSSSFNFVANRAGFATRIIKTDAEDHSWNEIKIDNRWVQIDPTIYYHFFNDPTNHSSYDGLWFDNPNAYNVLQWNNGYSRIYVEDSKEDLTAKYCNTSNLTVICQDYCDSVRISPENGQKISLENKIENLETTFVLGRKNYTVIAEKTIIPSLLVFEDSKNISLLAKSDSNVTLSPKEIKPTSLAKSLFDVSILIFLILIIHINYKFYSKGFKKLYNKINHRNK